MVTVRKDVAKLEGLFTAAGNVTMQSLWKVVWQFLKKLNIV